MEFLIVLAFGLAAGTLSGIVGFGSSIMLMPDHRGTSGGQAELAPIAFPPRTFRKEFPMA